jgi:hypothetical protein
VLLGLAQVEQLRLLGERAVAADAVDRPVASGGREPRARIGRRSVAWPAFRRESERVLGRVLSQVEVAGKTDQSGEDATPLIAEDLVEQRPTTP